MNINYKTTLPGAYSGGGAGTPVPLLDMHPHRDRGRL